MQRGPVRGGRTRGHTVLTESGHLAKLPVRYLRAISRRDENEIIPVDYFLPKCIAKCIGNCRRVHALDPRNVSRSVIREAARNPVAIRVNDREWVTAPEPAVNPEYTGREQTASPSTQRIGRTMINMNRGTTSKCGKDPSLA